MNNILRSFVILGAMAITGAAAHAQTLPLQPTLPQSTGPSLTGPSAGDQLQSQLNRDQLQTEERRLEDRSGSTNPSANFQQLLQQRSLNNGEQPSLNGLNGRR
jgi:hypothetical protein